MVPHRLPMRSAARLFCLFCLVFAAVAPLSRQPAEAATPEELTAAFTSNCFDAGYSYSATACEGWLATLPQSDAAWVLDNLIAPPLDSQDELGGAGWPNPDASRWTIGPPKSQLDTRQPAHFIRVERSPGGYWYNYYSGVIQHAMIHSLWTPFGWSHETHWRANFRFYWCDDTETMRGCYSSRTEWTDVKGGAGWKITQSGSASRTSYSTWTLYHSLSKIQRKTTVWTPVGSVGRIQVCDIETTIQLFPGPHKQSHWYAAKYYAPMAYKTGSRCNSAPVIG